MMKYLIIFFLSFRLSFGISILSLMIVSIVDGELRPVYEGLYMVEGHGEGPFSQNERSHNLHRTSTSLHDFTISNYDM
jgi:hypothetical protein